VSAWTVSNFETVFGRIKKQNKGELTMNDKMETTKTLPSCCRKHWEIAEGRVAIAWGEALFNPIGMPFMACKTCGNKRCPKATDCELECTGSNEPGQAGSIYG
jgi:hypothetical protein